MRTRGVANSFEKFKTDRATVSLAPGRKRVGNYVFLAARMAVGWCRRGCLPVWLTACLVSAAVCLPRPPLFPSLATCLLTCLPLFGPFTSPQLAWRVAAARALWTWSDLGRDLADTPGWLHASVSRWRIAATRFALAGAAGRLLVSVFTI